MPFMMAKQLFPAKFQYCTTLMVCRTYLLHFAGHCLSVRLSARRSAAESQGTERALLQTTDFLHAAAPFLHFLEAWHTQLCNHSTHLGDHHMEETSQFIFLIAKEYDMVKTTQEKERLKHLCPQI